MKNRQISFQVIKDDILDKIKSRHWLPGDTIPGEEELALQYGCSRMTVNRAIRELADSGVVERRRKAGTRVALQPERFTKITIPIVRKEIESRGAAYRYALLECSEIIAPEEVCAAMSLKKGGAVLRLRVLHFANETPYQYEERWINLECVPEAREESFEKINPNEWLISKKPFLDAEHVLSAQLADENVARLLQIKKGDALFVVERRTWSEQGTITSVKLYHPGATYRIMTH